MNGQALFGASAIPLIVGLIQVFKYSGLPARLSPAVALVIGVATGVISVWQTTNTHAAIPWAAGLVLGITWGLGASGLYEAGRQTSSALGSYVSEMYQPQAAVKGLAGPGPGWLDQLPPKPPEVDTRSDMPASGVSAQKQPEPKGADMATSAAPPLVESPSQEAGTPSGTGSTPSAQETPVGAQPPKPGV